MHAVIYPYKHLVRDLPLALASGGDVLSGRVSARAAGRITCGICKTLNKETHDIIVYVRYSWILHPFYSTVDGESSLCPAEFDQAHYLSDSPSL